MKTLVKAVLTSASIAVSSLANAALLDFDFSNGANASNATFSSELNFSNSGLDLEVTAYSANWFGGYSQSNVSQWKRGLGVSGGRYDTQVDGRYGDELLAFNFSEEVSLKSISFMSFDRNDQAQVYDLDADSFWDFYVTNIYKGETVKDGKGIRTFNFTQDIVSSYFGIEANDMNDNFTVYSMSVETLDVPESSSIALLGLGLLGLGLARRRAQA